MSTEIRVPTLGESVTEATIGQWFKKAGDTVETDEPLVELETDKVTIEVPAPAGGVLSEVLAEDGTTVEVGALLGSIQDGDGAAEGKAKDDAAEAADEKPADKPAEKANGAEPAAATSGDDDTGGAAQALSPAVRTLIETHKLDPDQIEGTGKDGRLTKGDVLAAVEQGGAAPTDKPSDAKPAKQAPASTPSSAADDADREERVRMTRLRQTIARRLKEAQNTAAMLTTFNEVDMSAVMDLRGRYKELFQQKHGVKLGFMGFFVKAAIAALKDIPAVNAEIDGDDLVYKNYYHIGVAVGTDKGLVVPVVRNADQMGLAEIENAIAEMGAKARDGSLAIQDMIDGTFTISNGGVYGSLMSTPILNAPQSGILGMHKIQERPMAVDGKVEIRPMMYLALSYDHRIVDGKEAVTFLVRIKDVLEDPERFVLDL